MSHRKFKAVIFDLGNVIVSADNHVILPYFRTHMAVDISDKRLEEILCGFAKGTPGKHIDEVPWWRQYCLGKISSRKFYETIRDELKLSKQVTFSEFHRVWSARFTLIHGTLTIIKHLSHHKRYLISDTNEFDAEWIMEHFPEIPKNFDAHYYSFEHGTDKYGPQGWQWIMRQSQLPPEAHVFIDDRDTNVERAVKLEMEGIVFTSPVQLEADLKYLGYL